MKVKCINNNHGELNLTVNKIYEVKGENRYDFYVINEFDICTFYSKTRFEIIPELTLLDAWELIKMAQEKSIKEGQVFDSYWRNVRQLSGEIEFNGKEFVWGDRGNPISLKDMMEYQFAIKEYLTFNEAKEDGVPHHKEFGYNYATIPADKFIDEMNKKVWKAGDFK